MQSTAKEITQEQARAMYAMLKAARDFIAFEGIGHLKEGLVADIDKAIAQAEQRTSK